MPEHYPVLGFILLVLVVIEYGLATWRKRLPENHPWTGLAYISIGIDFLLKDRIGGSWTERVLLAVGVSASIIWTYQAVKKLRGGSDS